MANPLVVNAVTGVAPWPTPTLLAHPRIFCPGGRLARATALWNSPPSNMTGLKGTWNSVGSSTTGYAISQALRYLFTGDTTSLTNAYNKAAAETFNLNTWNAVGPILQSPSSPFVLDWCYAGLSPAQRATLIGNCETFAQSAENAFTGTGSLEIADWIDSNGCAVYVYCILAAEGETGFTSRIAKLRNMLQHMQLWYDEVAGNGYRFSYPYQVHFMGCAYIAYHIAGGELASLPGRVGYLNGQREWCARTLNGTGQLYFSPPTNHRIGSAGTQAFTVQQPAWASAVFADAYADSVHAWITSQQLATQPNKWTALGTQNISDASWMAFFFYDSGQAITTPAAAGMSLCQEFPIDGLVNMRATWPNGTGVNCWFYAQACPVDNHSTSFGSSFLIYRNDDPLIADGYNYAGRPSGWENDPVSASVTNCVGNYSMVKNCAIFVPGSSSTPHRSGSQWNYMSGQRPTGSNLTYPWSWALQNNRGVGTFLNSKIVRYTDNTGGGTPECNVVGDSSNAYNNSTQVTKYLRYFSYVPGLGGTGTTSQGTYVIRDVFTAAGGMANALFSFWCKRKPTISGQTVIQGGSAAGVIKCTGNRAVITSVSGNSQATIDMISPAPSNVWLVGGGNGIGGAPAGPGYESFFDFNISTGSGGSNLDFSLNFQGGTGDSRNAPAYAWIQGQWRLEYQTTPVASGGQVVFVITVDAAGTTAPTYTLGQLQTIAPLAFTDVGGGGGGGGPVSSYPAPPFPSNMQRVLFRLNAANFNTTADQPLQQVGYLGKYRINKITVLNPSISLTTAAGGFYTGAGKTGTILVSSGQAYTALNTSANGVMLDLTLGAGATGNFFTAGTVPIFSLTTPQGAAATADIEVEGTDLT